MNKELSTLLKEIKNETGWSQTKIALETGISQPTVNRILKGQCDCKGSTLKSISALYNTVFKNRRKQIRAI